MKDKYDGVTTMGLVEPPIIAYLRQASSHLDEYDFWSDIEDAIHNDRGLDFDGRGCA